MSWGLEKILNFYDLNEYPPRMDLQIFNKMNSHDYIVWIRSNFVSTQIALGFHLNAKNNFFSRFNDYK